MMTKGIAFALAVAFGLPPAATPAQDSAPAIGPVEAQRTSDRDCRDCGFQALAVPAVAPEQSLAMLCIGNPVIEKFRIGGRVQAGILVGATIEVGNSTAIVQTLLQVPVELGAQEDARFTSGSYCLPRRRLGEDPRNIRFVSLIADGAISDSMRGGNSLSRIFEVLKKPFQSPLESYQPIIVQSDPPGARLLLPGTTEASETNKRISVSRAMVNRIVLLKDGKQVSLSRCERSGDEALITYRCKF